jgi:hypothetical protein
MSNRAENIWWAAYNEAQRFRLIEPIAIRHAWATLLLWYWWGYTEPDRPDIISGFRSPAKQAELLRRWQAGDRAGIIARPARRSWHMVGQALDVESNVRGFEDYAAIMRAYGLRDGRTFGDRGHFDYPVGPSPAPITV